MGCEGKDPRILNFGTSRTRIDVSNQSVSALTGLLQIYVLCEVGDITPWLSWEQLLPGFVLTEGEGSS
jgi:hypothetical protein